LMVAMPSRLAHCQASIPGSSTRQQRSTVNREVVGSIPTPGASVAGCGRPKPWRTPAGRALSGKVRWGAVLNRLIRPDGIEALRYAGTRPAGGCAVARSGPLGPGGGL
jgi:hypothetical protein